MTPGTVGILGAGTMGAGIAQVAVTHGWQVRLLDAAPNAVDHALGQIRARLDRLLEKERLAPDARDAALTRLLPASSVESFADCDLVIEAIVEDLGIKERALGDVVEAVRPECIIATNTSSLSVTALGDALGQAHRTVGMHFFNPAPLMKLVEVIAGRNSELSIVERVAEIARSWEKEVARASDVPGFIVNHVARPYYLEAFRIFEDGVAGVDDIDIAMKTLGGFRMGPFELTDLIGQDVNTATTRSVWEQLDRPPLLHPSAVQEQLVSDGHLGRKTGRGTYTYEGDERQPAIELKRRSFDLSPELLAAVDEFVRHATDRSGTTLQRYILARILAGIIVQAALANERGVADRRDIDIALKHGVNYPYGPFEWAERIGYDRVCTLLAELNKAASDDRFAIPESLQQLASSTA